MESLRTLQTNLEELRQAIEGVDPEEVERLAGAIADCQRVFVAGLGRSGLVMRMLALRLMQLGKQVHIVGDATTPAIELGDLLVVGSASGMTSGAVLAARQARRARASVGAITAKPRSALARISDHAVVIPGATPKSADGDRESALPLATVLEQAFLLVADCVVARLADRMGQTDEDMMARHANLE